MGRCFRWSQCCVQKMLLHRLCSCSFEGNWVESMLLVTWCFFLTVCVEDRSVGGQIVRCVCCCVTGETSPFLFVNITHSMQHYRMKYAWVVCVYFTQVVQLWLQKRICFISISFQPRQLAMIHTHSRGRWSIGRCRKMEKCKTRQLLVYADDVNWLGENISTIQRKTHKTSQNGGGYKTKCLYVHISSSKCKTAS
jgi:hypothetical protein